MKIPFVGPAYESRILPLNAQRCVNLYLESGGPAAKEPVALVGSPGLRKIAELPTGPVDGLHVWDGTLYACGGGTLYEVQSTSSIVSRGTIGSGYAKMENNGNQLVVCNGFWIVWDGTTLSTVSGGSGSHSVVYGDGYMIGFARGTQEFFISAANNATSIDGADFASAEYFPDDVVGIAINRRELYLLGARGGEIWVNTGNPDFPYERAGNTVMEAGCLAEYSVAQIGGAVYWLGTDSINGGRIVYRAEGYQPLRISTHAIERFLDSADDVSDARAFAYTQEGHGFYCLSVGGRTFSYDIATQQWHERAYLYGDELVSWRANCAAYWQGMNIVGDSTSGNIYALDLDYYKDDSHPSGTFKALRSTGPLSDSGKRTFWSQLFVDVEPGVGLASGQGADPQMMLRYSDDGGFTWSNELAASMGAIGRYESRAEWYRLGQGRNRVYEVSITDPVKRAILGATANE
jgi:hypothetical protein